METKPEIQDNYVTTSSGLKYKILKKGTGRTAQNGDEVLIFETVSYHNGKMLFSNENTSNPVKVLIGGNQATSATDEALRCMKTGEIRELVAPPELVKRKFYPPDLSPDSTLVIKLILHEIL
ncbi:MAG: FKBP-type peptidyl-prolyl cis-trans isomerase [Calditrichaeota bacterium]|nr:FKBP-type peptidyl-prolyl cis-trans isomerase [Calditrichota bacterium]